MQLPAQTVPASRHGDTVRSGNRRKVSAVVAGAMGLLAVAGCGASGLSNQTTTAPEPETTVLSQTSTTAGVLTTSQSGDAAELAEEFVDAFYSWDRDALEGLPWAANAELDEITYYQGWAEAGNYRVLDRQPCEANGSEVTCAVTVEDDLVKALDLDFNVTDTFSLTISDGEIESVATSSNDPELVHQAFDWVLSEDPSLMEGPCKGFFAGGPTPDKCIEAIIAGFERFAASEDFPG